MKFQADFDEFKWRQLETHEEAEADHAHTGPISAFAYWHLTDQGDRFFVLRDDQNVTRLTTCVYARKAPTFSAAADMQLEVEYLAKAVDALRSSLGMAPQERPSIYMPTPFPSEASPTEMEP